MPRLSVIGVRLALLYFLLGITCGALLLINKAYPLHPAVWGLLPLHIEFLLSGWIVQLVFAIAYWIFPRYIHEPKRGHPHLAWAALALLNAGIWVLAAVSLAALAPEQAILGRGLQVAAMLLLAASLWGRAKPTETGLARAAAQKSTQE